MTIFRSAQIPVDATISALSVAAGLVLAIVTGDTAVLFAAWVVLVVGDFTSAGLRVFLTEDEHWSGRTALRGAAKKAGYLLAAFLAAGFDFLAAYMFRSPWIADSTPAAKAMLIMLIGIESGSIAQNILRITGNWRVYKLLMRGRDAFRAGLDELPDRRWYDHTKPPPPADEDD